MKFYSIDRFEEDFAILIDDQCATICVKRNELPVETKEGSVVSYENGEYSLAPDEEDVRRRRITNLQNKLFKK